MKKSRTIIFLSIVLFVFACRPNTYETEYVIKEVNVIPMPNRIERTEGHFLFRHDSKIIVPIANKEIYEVAEYFTQKINSSSSLNLPIMDTSVTFRESIAVFQFSDDKSLGNEGYKIRSSEDSVLIEANSKEGFFNGIQTIMQLLPHEIFFPERTAGILCKVPNLIIEDKPALNYRGMHLDVVNFFPEVEEIKYFIELLAMHRMNKLHLQLASDGVCRIEIKKYPEMTKGVKHYTQEQMKEIIDYANVRCITIIPEFDFHDQMGYITKSHPEITCTHSTENEADTDIEKNTLCYGNDKAIDFAKDVLRELTKIFPSEMIHLGGKNPLEVNITYCKNCSLKTAEYQLDSLYGLQNNFNERLATFLTARNRKAILWETMMNDSLSENFVIMAHDSKSASKAAKKGYKVIHAPKIKACLSYYQADKDIEPEARMGLNILKNVYSLTPIPEDLVGDEKANILGIQGCLQTDFIRSFDDLEYMLLPRLSAIAEVGWVHKRLHFWDDFKVRIVAQYRRYQNMKVNYHIPTPIGMTDGINFEVDTVVKLDNPLGYGKMYYTLNGARPSKASNPYVGPIRVKKTSILRAMVSTYSGRGSTDIKTYFFKTDPKDEYKHGLTGKFYDGNFSDDPNQLSEKEPNKTLVLFDNNYFNKIEKSDDISITVEGFIKIEKSGDYTFHIASFDKSTLYLNDEVLIDIPKTGVCKRDKKKINLTTGMHKIYYQYFEDNITQAFGIYIEGPGIKKQLIPYNLLYHK